MINPRRINTLKTLELISGSVGPRILVFYLPVDKVDSDSDSDACEKNYKNTTQSQAQTQGQTHRAGHQESQSHG